MRNRWLRFFLLASVLAFQSFTYSSLAATGSGPRLRDRDTPPIERIVKRLKTFFVKAFGDTISVPKP